MARRDATARPSCSIPDEPGADSLESAHHLAAGGILRAVDDGRALTKRQKRRAALRAAALFLVTLLLSAGIASDRGPHLIPSAGLVDYLDRTALELLRQSPETITTRGLAANLGVRNDSLDALALDSTEQSYAPLRDALARIRDTDLRWEDARTQRCVATFAWWLESALEGRPYQDDVCLVSTYMTSIPQHIVWFLFHVHPLATSADAEDYISRLAQIPDRFEQLRVRLSASEAKKALAPRFLLVRAADEIEAIGRQSLETSELFTRFADAARGMADLSPGDQEGLLDKARHVLMNVALPAYVDLAETVRQFASRATDDIGAWRFADGDAYYAYLLRTHTTTNMTAGEIDTLGLREVARIQSEVRAAAAALGYDASLSLGDLFAQIRAHAGAITGQAAVAACRDLVQEASVLSRPAFLDMPTGLPTVEAGGSIAYFAEGSEDGSRPGIFYVPVDQARSTFSLPSLVYHETIPGHFLQLAAARDAGLPEYLGGVGFSGYTEGWATYAERLAWELGAYEDDPLGNIGRLQEELFRAARLVVDTGIHARRWTYDEAVSYMTDATGLDEATVRDEVERYIVTPGQATAYAVGFYKLLELRERAQGALGDALDLAEFHRAVLSCGSVPLPILEAVVEEYIAARRPSGQTAL